MSPPALSCSTQLVLSQHVAATIGPHMWNWGNPCVLAPPSVDIFTQPIRQVAIVWARGTKRKQVTRISEGRRGGQLWLLHAQLLEDKKPGARTYRLIGQSRSCTGPWNLLAEADIGLFERGDRQSLLQ
ncbi:hypothetical protein MHYP_G00097220 [Metynnis hypsauchen]